MNKTIIADRIRTARNERHMTQIRLAEALGVSKGTVAMWEAEKRQPGTDMIVKICRTLDVPVGFLFGECNVQPKNQNNELDKVIEELSMICSHYEEWHMDVLQTKCYRKAISFLVELKQIKEGLDGNDTYN